MTTEDDGARSACHNGPAAYLEGDHPEPVNNPDAKLFALEAEMKAAHQGLDAAENTTEAHDPWYRRINDAQDAAIAISAQTEAGVMAKLRMTAWFLDNPSETDEVYAVWLRSAVTDAKRIGAPNGGIGATRIGDVLLEAYPFEKLRVNLKEASKEVEKAAADRSEVDDNAFAELIERQDSVVAQLAARGPASGGEAIFLLRILRDRMDADFDPSVIEAANRDIVRGVTAYLSGLGGAS